MFDLLFGNKSLTVTLEVLKRPNSWEMWELESCNQFACIIVACLTVRGNCTLVMFDFLDNRFDNWFNKYYKIIKNFTVNDFTMSDCSFTNSQFWLLMSIYGVTYHGTLSKLIQLLKRMMISTSWPLDWVHIVIGS